jgi:hypothetical protein
MPSPPHDSERIAAHLRAFIAAKKYDELFSQGGCFHLAQRAWKMGIGKLHCTVSGLDTAKADHVFVVAPDGLVFDRLGFRTAHDLLTERKSEPGQNRSITPEEVDAHIRSTGIGDDLHQEIYGIADDLIADIKAGGEPKTRTMRIVAEIQCRPFGASHGDKSYDFEPTTVEIQRAIDSGELETRGAQADRQVLEQEWLRQSGGNLDEIARLQKIYNARRIAHFVVRGWTDPIVLAENGDMIEGTHRLKAAIHKHMEKVGVRIAR